MSTFHGTTMNDHVGELAKPTNGGGKKEMGKRTVIENKRKEMEGSQICKQTVATTEMRMRDLRMVDLDMLDSAG
jgi:hypothetical protein